MKKLLGIFFISLIFLNSCAKPTVVAVALPEDDKLNCEKLEIALDDAQIFREKARAEVGSTPQNQARAILFWPALMVTYVNVHEAMMAAQERSIHLINLMQDKKCKNVDKIISRVSSTHRVQTLKDLNETYKTLNELYKTGALTEDEFRKEKKKILGQ